MTDLDERYGSSRRGTPVVAGVAAAIALVFLGWLAWSTWANAHPQVTSQLQGWEAEGPHQVTARIDVSRGAGAGVATCTLRAFAEDHSTVGEKAVEVRDSGRLSVSLRTEREATAVELLGCTTPDQPRPR